MHRQDDEYGYTSWIRPWLGTSDMSFISSDLEAMLGSGNQAPSQVPAQPAPEPRSRGRPRVYTARNESALEKRRAQVRNAQRAYQQRKDNAAQATNQRQNQIIEAFSDLAAEVEKLLKASSGSDVLNGNDEVGAHIRSLWDTYDNVINRPCIMPEMEQQRASNELRQKFHQRDGNSQVSSIDLPEARDSAEDGHSAMTTAMVRGDDSSLVSTLFWVESKNMMFCDQDFLDVVADTESSTKR